MKIWIYLDGQQQGPFELEQLMDMEGFDENTKVWFEGLPKWYPAGTLDELRPLFDSSTPMSGAEPVHTEPQRENEPVAEEEHREEETASDSQPDTSRFAPGARYVYPAQLDEPCPPTYLGWSIFLLICCCSPVSLGALIASLCVSSFYNSGKLEKSKKASEWAAWLIMISIALGMLPVMLMSSLY
ncbi:MAG: CD225/dispanin family protein [Muribaculaceae bacterium]|nr:CD225/dispanin family protein [Muribaculaceae bacterium]